MSVEDMALADRIAHVKAEELKVSRFQRLMAVVRNAVLRLKQNLLSQGKPPIVWPWDVRSAIKEASMREERPAGPRRRLMDAYGDSLRFVNKLYNKHFQKLQRKVPAHMPHYLDKSILSAMQATWPEQWNATSSHRFRSSEDMQYAFSYFYYLIHQPADFELDAQFNDELDLDGDGRLNKNEIKVFAWILYGRNTRVTDADLDELQEYLQNCTLVDIQQRVDDGAKVSSAELAMLEDAVAAQDEEELRAALLEVPITVRSIRACPDVYNKMQSLAVSHRKYKHEVVGLNEVEFYMVQDNWTVAKDRLDGIRAKMPKFICLNDDIKTPDPDPKIFETLKEFYESYFPVPSPFELPPEQYHLHLWLDELQAAPSSSPGFYQTVRSIALLVLFVSVAGIVLRRLVTMALNDSGSKQS